MVANLLHELIVFRCTTQNISRRDLVSRAGYTNIAKGLRRLEGIKGFDFETTTHLIDQLPNVLGVTRGEVQRSIRITMAAIASERELAWRQNFMPYSLVRTLERGRPRQITMAALCGAGHYVRYVFPDDATPDEFVRLAVAAYRKNERDIRRFFYPPEDIVVNYTLDWAARYTLEGEFLEELSAAIKPGSLTITFR